MDEGAIRSSSGLCCELKGKQEQSQKSECTSRQIRSLAFGPCAVTLTCTLACAAQGTALAFGERECMDAAMAAFKATTPLGKQRPVLD